jgi:preprotein translocase subunit SecB
MTEQSTPPEGGANQDQSKAQQLGIKRIFVKDVSFEVPLGIKVHARQWKPEINQDINIEVIKIDDVQYEVVLKITVYVQEEEQVVCLVEVHQAGVFVTGELKPEQRHKTLNTTCPTVLFPYARELIDNLVVRGTFPALSLPPVNFDALYKQAMAQQQQAETDGESSTTLN